MVLDTSAVLAILLREPGYETLLQRIVRGGPPKIGAPTHAEAGIVVVARLGFSYLHLLYELLEALGAEVIPFTEKHAREAIRAYKEFGRAQHPAGLNFGDCLSYATARVEGMPLLYKGDDFAQTDLGQK